MNPRRRRYQRLRRAEARKPIGRAFTHRARRKDWVLIAAELLGVRFGGWPDRMIAKILSGA